MKHNVSIRICMSSGNNNYFYTIIWTCYVYKVKYRGKIYQDAILISITIFLNTVKPVLRGQHWDKEKQVF